MTMHEIVLQYGTPTGEMLNVLHYDLVGTEPFDFQDIADNIRTSFVAGLASVIAPVVVLEGIRVRLDLPGEVGQFYAFTAGAAPGLAADNQYLASPTLLVQKLANNLIRPNKGRIAQGGVTVEATTSAGQWNTLARDACDIFWADMILINFAGASTAQMQIKASNPLAPNTVPYNPVNAVFAKPNPGTMSRRLRGVGS